MKAASIIAVMASLYCGSAHAESDRDTIEYLSTTCSMGSSYSCYTVGLAHLNGDGTIKNPKKAFPYFKNSCKLGLKEGCNAYAAMLYVGQGIEANTNTALDVWKENCADGSETSCQNIKFVGTLKEDSPKPDLKSLGVAKYICGVSSYYKCSSTY